MLPARTRRDGWPDARSDVAKPACLNRSRMSSRQRIWAVEARTWAAPWLSNGQENYLAQQPICTLLSDQVGQPELGRGAGHTDRADDQAKAALVGGEHVLNRDPHPRPAGVAAGDVRSETRREI
jgi:hypothetical protein